MLSADGNAAVGSHTLTVQVEDEEGSQAETVVQVEIVAASTAASIISPPALGGGASALALAGGGLSLLIIAPPASSLARPRTPPQARRVRICERLISFNLIPKRLGMRLKCKNRSMATMGGERGRVAAFSANNAVSNICAGRGMMDVVKNTM